MTAKDAASRRLRSNALESVVPHVHESVGMRVRVGARTSRCKCWCGAACDDLTKGSQCLGGIGPLDGRQTREVQHNGAGVGKSDSR